jgi:hypothetical protein
VKADFFSQVPRDLGRNLRYRIELRKRAQGDAGFRRAMLTACKHDILFFFAAWCWLYEPRPRKTEDGITLPNIIPFIPWDHQIPVIREIDEHLGFRDIGMEKSRGEGASWIAVLFSLHRWLFRQMSAIGLVSRTENAVDNPDDPDSLMWKLDWELEQLPRWMGGVKDKEYKRTLSDHTLKNLRNGSTITGYAATGDVASGGRKLFFLADELAKFPRGPDREAMASTQHVTDSRFVVSTPKGSEGAYYELMHEPSNMVKLVLDWQMNPTRNRGMYTFVDGVPVAVDPVNNPLPDNYNPPTKKILDLFSRLRRKGFVLERRKRSPWYDRECDRPGATPQNIAQELDRDYGGSAYRFFGDEFFRAAEKTVLQPVSRGVVTYHPETLEPEFQTTRDGPVQLWCNLDVQNSPPESTYVVGADISSGLGGSYTSNSVVEVVDVLTMEQVMEYAINTVSPTEFAEHCVAIAKWFHDAYLIWEANGPGAAFTNRAKALSYPNVYYRSVLWRRGSKKTKEMGWWSDTRTRQALFGEVRRRVVAGTLKLRSDSLVKECQQYQVVADQIIHTGAAKTLDDSSRGQAHGDRVIAMGVCLHGVADRPLTKVKADEVRRTKIPYGSMAWRQQEYEESLRAKDDPWDARSNWDLALRR